MTAAGAVAQVSGRYTKYGHSHRTPFMKFEPARTTVVTLVVYEKNQTFFIFFISNIITYIEILLLLLL